MEFGISTQFHGTNQVSVDTLESLRKAGYNQIELFCNRPHIDFHNRGLLRAIGRWFEENALPAPSIHLPFVEDTGTQRLWVTPLDSERRLRDAAMDEYKRCLEVVDGVGAEYVVMHLGNPGQAYTPIAYEYAYAAIFQIQQFCGARVMLENIPNEISTIERIEEFRTVSELSDVGICYDSGHGHIQGVTGSLDFMAAMHIHDNHGDRDEHLWPFEGNIHWPAFIEKLVLNRYSGRLVFEARGEDLRKGEGVRSRLNDLWDEADNSIEEFRLKYKLPPPRNPELD